MHAFPLPGTTVFEGLVLHSASTERIVEPDTSSSDGGMNQQQRARATVKEPCPKCSHPEMQYYTMQCVADGQTLALPLQPAATSLKT
jgi:hypothetical protein